MYQKSRRVGIAAIVCALIFRFFSPRIFPPLVELFTQPNTVAFLIYLETGRNVRFSASPEVSYPPESPPPAIPPPTEPTQPALPVFGDTSRISLYYASHCRPDLEALLRRPLQWDLASGEPAVLILHTHTTESYTRSGEPYEESAPYRTLDERYNVVSIGDQVAEILEAAGINVIHDRTLHDYPAYNGSYGRCRETAAARLRQYPSLLLVMDIHRDAADTPSGQMRTVAHVEGMDSAQIMFVMGTDESAPNPHWEYNLSLALKLQAQLETQSPGITRPLCLRPQRFNQDLAPGCMLIEVGSAGNSHREATLAARQLGLAITTLARGTG